MRSFAVAALLAGCALANPVPQDFDWDAIDALDPIETPDIPIVDAAAAQTTLAAAPTDVAASSVSAAVFASPTDSTLKLRDASCVADVSDTDAAWIANTQWAQAATSATTPTGYTLAYQNANGSSQGVYGYMGYTLMDSYDASGCSARCDSTVGCQSFNLYYERDPATNPTDSCPNPSSQTVIKCVYYGGPVTAASTTNVGQYQEQFHVVIGGSNGYVNNSIEVPAGYASAQYLGNAAINALNDCNSHYTYMGVKIFTKGAFSASNCAAACSATSAYNLAHPPKNGVAQTCQFFNTYVLYNGSTAVGQYCAMYNETWPASYATNVGQWRGPNHYTIGYSYAFSNSTGNRDQPVGCSNPAHP